MTRSALAALVMRAGSVAPFAGAIFMTGCLLLASFDGLESGKPTDGGDRADAEDRDVASDGSAADGDDLDGGASDALDGDGGGDGGGDRRDAKEDSAELDAPDGDAPLGDAADGGIVETCPIVGRTPELRGIAVVNGDVYWAEGNGLWRQRKDAASPERLDEGEPVKSPSDVAYDGRSIYWTEPSTWLVGQKQITPKGPADAAAISPGFPPQYIAAVPTAGEGGAFIRLWMSAFAGGAAADGGFVLYYPPSAVAYRRPLPPSGIAVAGNFVFWGADHDVEQGSTVSPGVQPDDRFASPGRVSGVAAETLPNRHTRVYWISGGTAILWLDRDVATRALTHYEPALPIGEGDIAVDGDRLYFNRPASGSICWVPKP